MEDTDLKEKLRSIEYKVTLYFLLTLGIICLGINESGSENVSIAIIGFISAISALIVIGWDVYETIKYKRLVKKQSERVALVGTLDNHKE